MLHPDTHERPLREPEAPELVGDRMVAEDQLRAAQVDPDAGRAGDERRAVQHAVDVGVGHHGGIGQRAPAAARDREREHVPSVHDEPAAPPAADLLERDLLDALREAPDAAARRAGEALVHGQLPDVGRDPIADEVERRAEVGDAGPLAAGADEERERDLVVVAEVVVAVVDGRDAEERAAGQQLDHLELGPGEKAAGGRARDQVGRRGRRRVAHDHGHRHLAALEDPATACGRDGGLGGHGALFYGASWPGCKAHIPCTLSGRTLYMTRTSPGRRNGYLSWPRYFFARASMCASAPFSMVSTTRPRTCT